MRSVNSETLTLVAICIADLLTTLYFMSCGLAYELNPMMAGVLSYGIWAFIGIKLMSVLPFVVLIEIYRLSEPERAKNITKLVCVVYLLIYVYVTVHANFA